jgi:hypothetical protein
MSDIKFILLNKLIFLKVELSHVSQSNSVKKFWNKEKLEIVYMFEIDLSLLQLYNLKL